MRVTILHQAVDHAATESEKDVFQQAELVAESLRRLGHTAHTTEVTLDLRQIQRDLVTTPPDRVFYLVESLDGTDSLAHLPAFLLEAMHIPYTGVPAAAVVLANNKVRAKRVMARAGLPTPPWLDCCPPPDTNCRGDTRPPFPATFIVKPIEEHASRGMTDACVFGILDEPQLREKLQELSGQVNYPCFAEQFVDGREFNLALLGVPEGPIVLPPAEIDFGSFPPGKPHIVGYDAKWSPGSFEFENTPRRFPCGPGGGDFELGRKLAALARHCWDEFGLRGYARVDFRVDEKGHPWILEVNTNPCLSPDAGFVAALHEAGIPIDQAIQSILDDV